MRSMKHPIQLPKNAKIVIIRLSALGDVCHTMSVVSAIQKRYPKAEITWITGKLEAQLVEMMPNVNIEVYDKKSGLKGMLAIRQRFQNKKFDALLHMQWSFRASLLSRMLKAGVRVGFCKSQSREKQHWFVNQLAPIPTGLHVLDSLMSIAKVIDVNNSVKPFWNIKQPIKKTALPVDYVIVNPCASDSIRNWTLDGYRNLIAFLMSQNQKVVLTGGVSKSEVDFVNQVATGLDVINLVGATSLVELTAVIREAKLIISPDTGPVHIATMVDTPVIGLYALSNSDRTGPYLAKNLVISAYTELAEQEYGKPLNEIPWSSRVHDVHAMEYIKVEDVIAKVNKVLVAD